MLIGSSTFRLFLAAVVALWAPLACCCIAKPTADSTSAASCHVQPQSQPACSHCPSENRGETEQPDPQQHQKCGCSKVSALDEHREVNLTPSTASDTLMLLTALSLQPIAFDLAVEGRVFPSPPADPLARAPGSLVSLHCLLTV